MTDAGLATLEYRLPELLLLASLVAIVTRRAHVPYSVALVAAGLGIGALGLIEDVHLTSDLIILVFLPPLLFDGAINMDLPELRRRWPAVATLAVPGTLVTAGVTTAMLVGATDLPFRFALLIGVIMAATDPVAVLATLKERKVEAGLKTLLEGESIFNDALGIVLFGLAVDYAFPALHEDVTIRSAARSLVWEAGAGVAIGFATGFAVHFLMRSVSDHLIEVTLSVVAVFGAFLLAHEVEASGVFAVVTAGLVLANYGPHLAMAPASQEALAQFWEIVAFLLNSALFLLIGAHIDPGLLIAARPLGIIAAGVAGLLAGRALACYGLLWIFRGRARTPLVWRHAIFWGGLRGSIPIALALGLTVAEQEQSPIDLGTVVFGMVLVSIFAQGLTFPLLLQRLGLEEK